MAAASMTRPRPREPRAKPGDTAEMMRQASGGAPLSIVDRLRAFRRPMSVPELADVLGHSDDVIYRMVHAEKIPRLIIPGSEKICFDPATIDYWLCHHNPILKKVAKAR